MKRVSKNCLAAGLIALVSACAPETPPGHENEVKEPSVEALVTAENNLSVEVTLKTEKLISYAYVCSKDGNASEDVNIIFATGTVGELTDGENTVVISGLEALSDYRINFAFKKSEEEFYGNIVSVDARTADYTDNFTVVNKSLTGLKFHLKVPQSVKDVKHGVRYSVGSYPMYYSAVMEGGNLDPDILLYNGLKETVEDLTLTYDENNIYELDENGQPVTDEYSGEYIMLHTPFAPGEPLVVLAGEFAYDPDDSYYFGKPGYYTACFDYDKYWEDNGGGWDPWSTKAVEADDEQDSDRYWTGWFTRKYVVLDRPTALDCDMKFEYNMGAVNGEVTFIPDDNIYMYCYMIIPDYDYESMLSFIFNDEQYLQWLVTSYPAMQYWGAQQGQGKLNIKLQESLFLEPETEYHLLVTALGDEKGSSQKFFHEKFATTSKTHPAPEVEVKAIANPSGTESPFEAWFNIRCTSGNAVSGKYAAEYEREFAMMINNGYTYQDLANQGNQFSASDIREINSDKGMNVMFSSMANSKTRLAVVLYNDEETPNEFTGTDDPSSALCITIAEPAHEHFDSPLFDELSGEWTMTAPVLDYKYISGTEYSWVDAGVLSCKITVAKGFTYPETLDQSVYDTYKKVVGLDKEAVDDLYEGFKQEVDEYNAMLKSCNRLIATGWGFQKDGSGYLKLTTPFDLFCDDKYNGYDNESMIWDCGPKWMIEIRKDGTAFVPVNSNKFYPNKTAGSYTIYLTGLSEVGYASVGPDNSIAEFPLVLSDDNKTITFEPWVYNGSEYHLNSMYFYYGRGFLTDYKVAGGRYMTKGWTETAAAAAPASYDVVESSPYLSSIPGAKTVSSMRVFRKTPLKLMKKTETRTYEIVPASEAIANMKNAVRGNER